MAVSFWLLAGVTAPCRDARECRVRGTDAPAHVVLLGHTICASVPVIPTSSCFRARHPHVVLLSSSSSSPRPAFAPVIPTSSCRDARECLAGGRPFLSKRNIVLFSSRHPPPHRPAFVPVIPTSSCRDARSVRPLCQKLQHRDLTGTDVVSKVTAS